MATVATRIGPAGRGRKMTMEEFLLRGLAAVPAGLRVCLEQCGPDED